MAPDGIGIVSDTTVFHFYGRALESLLESRGHRVVTVVLPPGETSKNMEIAVEIYGELCENRFSRRSVLLALGGGVVGDLTGFVAGTYMRGIRFLQLPTSLLAQVDSSIGGKVGVNHRCGKNLVGLFHQPAAIWADTRCLSTLPPAEYLNAFGEILKYALVLDEALFARLEALPSVETVRADETLQAEVVRRCIRSKVAVVEQDEHEAGRRRVLNFGHTFGHAFESAGRYSLYRHGEAVALGMLLAQELGVEVGAVDRAWAERATGLIRRLLPLPPRSGPGRGQTLSATWGGTRRTPPGGTSSCFPPDRAAPPSGRTCRRRPSAWSWSVSSRREARRRHDPGQGPPRAGDVRGDRPPLRFPQPLPEPGHGRPLAPAGGPPPPRLGGSPASPGSWTCAAAPATWPWRPPGWAR